MRAAEAHRHAEPLARPNDGICAPLAGRDEQGQRQQVGRDQNERAARVQCVADRTIIAYVAPDARILQQRGEAIGACRGRRRPDHDRQTKWCGTRAHDVEGLRQDIVGDVDGGACALADAARERHCLGGRSRLVEHRRVGDLHAREVGHHGLEVRERLEPALRDLRLVRRVGGVPGGVLEHVAQDHGRRDGAVVPHADERRHDSVAPDQVAQSGQHLGLGGGRCQRQVVVADRRRHGPLEQGIDRWGGHDGEHLLSVGIGQAEVALDELVMVLEAREAGAGLGHRGLRNVGLGSFPRCRTASSVASP